VVVLTLFFAIGVLISSKFSHLFAEAQFDLHRFLFGDVLTLSWLDLLPLAFSGFVSLGALVWLQKDWDAWVSDPEFAQLAGFRVKWVSALFPVLVTSTVLCGIWTVGSLMISALITLPAVLVQPSTVLSKASIATALLIGLLGSLAGFALDLPMGSSLVLTGGLFVLIKVIAKSR
jgi:ABC-type Mn2+/Zn2+ transport system permease subunit